MNTGPDKYSSCYATTDESPETKKKQGQKVFWSPSASAKPSETQVVH